MFNLYDYLSLPMTLLGIHALMAMSLQVVLGGAGLLSLGQATFFAVGGYASAVLTTYWAPIWGIGHPGVVFLLGTLFAMAIAAVVGALVALPCLRLQGDYLAMATLGVGEIAVTVLKNSEWLGGTRGFKDIPKLANPWSIWTAVFLVFVFLKRLYGTGFGSAMMATRDDPIAARSLGVSTQKIKMQAFILGSGLSGLAGSFYSHTLQFMSPDEASFVRSVEIVLAVVIGGMNSLFGSILGAILLVALPEVLRFAPEVISQNRMLLFSSVVIITMLLKPEGLISFFQKNQRHFSFKS